MGAFQNRRLLSTFFVLMSIGVLDGQQTLGGPTHGRVVVCYVATWAVYRPGAGSYSLEKLDPSLCTHLVYSFAGLDATTSSIKSLDAWQDLEDNYGKNGFKRMVALKTRYPHLKVTIAIGGWNEGSLKYSMLAEDPEKRGKFVKSVVDFLKRFGFDGLDLDWEYPARRDGRPQDKANYVTLVKDLKAAFQPHGYILTAALGAGRDTMEAAYDLARLSKYLDLVHMMCYDYHGTWDGLVGPNAPVRGFKDPDVLSLEYTIKYMISHGVSPYKLVLGLPVYGRTFELVDPTVKDIVFGVTPAKSQGFQGPFTRENGFMGYNEICLELTNATSGWTEHWDERSETPYLRRREKVIAYDNARSIALKVKLAVDYDLGGLMVWSIDTDDFRGDCRPEMDAFDDFRNRYDELARSPVLNDVMERLNLPGGSHRESIAITKNAYTIENGKLSLRLPERNFNNYILMRTINEAVSLAQEEKKIYDEVEKRMKENEIEDDNKDTKGEANALLRPFWIVAVTIAVSFCQL